MVKHAPRRADHAGGWLGESMFEETPRRRPGGAAPGAIPPRGPWRLADIDYDAIDPLRVRDDPTLFEVVTLASFIETGSDLYAHNLAEYFDDDPEVAGSAPPSRGAQGRPHGRAPP